MIEMTAMLTTMTSVRVTDVGSNELFFYRDCILLSSGLILFVTYRLVNEDETNASLFNLRLKVMKNEAMEGAVIMLKSGD
jgi:hypothetical protein